MSIADGFVIERPLGEDNSDNDFSSTNVTANEDGSVLERLEYIQSLLNASSADSKGLFFNGTVGTQTASTTSVLCSELAGYSNDFFNSRYYMQIIKAGAAAPEGEIRQITDYVSATGTFTVSAFSQNVETGDIFIILHESLIILEKLVLIADGGTNAYPDSVAQESIIAYILSKSANPVATSYNNTTDSLEAISDAIALIDGLLDVPTQDLATDSTINQVVGKKSDTVAGTSIVSLVKQALASLTTNFNILTGVTTNTVAVKREAGRTQVKTVAITSAANAGLVTLATVTSQACTIKSIVLSADGATTADLTSAAIKGGASEVIEFISAATAVKANIDAADEQVTFSGVRVIPATGTIKVDLQGTGATAVALKAIIEYYSNVDGGYLA